MEADLDSLGDLAPAICGMRGRNRLRPPRVGPECRPPKGSFYRCELAIGPETEPLPTGSVTERSRSFP
jgi:hypothetical protein